MQELAHVNCHFSGSLVRFCPYVTGGSMALQSCKEFFPCVVPCITACASISSFATLCWGKLRHCCHWILSIEEHLSKNKGDFCTKLAILEHISAEKSDRPSRSSSGLGAMCMDEETVRWMRKLLGLGLVNTSHSLQYSLLYINKRDFCTNL